MRFNDYERRVHDAAFDPSIAMVVLLDSVPVGWYAIAESAQGLILNDFYIAQDQRGKGIGGAILERLVAESEQTRRPMSLVVFKTNPARRLYERYGFVQVGGKEHFFLMERRVSAGGADVKTLDS